MSVVNENNDSSTTRFRANWWFRRILIIGFLLPGVVIYGTAVVAEVANAYPHLRNQVLHPSSVIDAFFLLIVLSGLGHLPIYLVYGLICRRVISKKPGSYSVNRWTLAGGLITLCVASAVAWSFWTVFFAFFAEPDLFLDTFPIFSGSLWGIIPGGIAVLFGTFFGAILGELFGR